MTNRVRQVREALGIPLKELARKAKVGSPILSRAERGLSPFYPALRRRVSEALEIKEDRLFAGKETKR